MAISEGEVSTMLTALTHSRQRMFLRMVEDECLNLLHRYRSSKGRVRTLKMPPLSQNLRELVSMTTQRFLLRDICIAEGDLEKQLLISVHAASRVPCILYSDLIPSMCPLVSHALYGPPPQHTKKADSTPSKSEPCNSSMDSPNSPVGSPAQQNSGASTTTPQSAAAGRGRARPAMGVYRPRRMVEMRAAAAQDIVPTQDHLAENTCTTGDSKIVDDDAKCGDGDVSTTAEMSMATEESADATMAVDKEAQNNIVDASKAAENVEIMAAHAVLDQDDEQECGLVHTYERYRMDLTPKPWFEQQRKQAYVEFEASPASAGKQSNTGRTNRMDMTDTWRWDESWQLKAKSNGSVSFCIQADTMEGATIQVGHALAEEIRLQYIHTYMYTYIHTCTHSGGSCIN
jgi:hypothetical protein